MFYLGVPIGYKVNDRLALTAQPKLAFYGPTRKYGLGLGVNYQLFNGFQLIGEVTPVSGGAASVWAAGMRYFVPNSGAIVDLHATNAIGRYGLGTMVAQTSIKIALGLRMQLNLKRR